jgi:hypothetical protein
MHWTASLPMDAPRLSPTGDRRMPQRTLHIREPSDTADEPTAGRELAANPSAFTAGARKQ